MKSTANVAAIYPLSPTQAGMLFYLLNADEGDLSYREQLRFSIDRTTPVSHLKQAWQQVVNRHPVLRSLYSWENKAQPFQIVLKETPLIWVEHDLSQLNEEESAQCVSELSLRARQTKLQLDKQPPLQLDYFKLNDGTAQLIFTFTHLQLDGWSMALISNEVEAILQQLITNEPVVLSPAGDYKEYVRWLLSRDMSSSLTYWHNLLVECDATSPLHIQHSSANDKTATEKSIYCHQIAIDNSQIIQNFCRQHGLTLNVFMLAVFGYLNNLSENRQQSIIGSVVSGRPAEIEDIDKTAGFFSNALPSLINSHSSASFLDWVKQIQHQVVESWDHSFVSLEQIKSSLKLAVTESLYSTLFIFQNYPKKNNNVDEVKTPILQRQQGAEQSHYPLTLYISVNNTISIWASFDTQHYHLTEVQQLLSYYQDLMLLCIQQSDQSLTDLQLLTPNMRQQLEKTAIGPTDPHLLQVPLSSRLNSLTMGHQQVALVDGHRRYTYQQLAQHVSHISQQMTTQGIAAGQRVALCLGRSAEFIIASLACLHKGVSYVPIDPEMPQERQQFILQDAKITLVISDTDINTGVIPLWRKEELLAINAAEVFPCAEIHDQAEAYVIYTSGSTGNPKGVSVSRKALCHYALSAAKYYQLSNTDHALQFASVSFDTAVEEIYPTLFSHGRLILRDDTVLSSARSFNNFLSEQQITILNLPTAYWMHLVTLLEDENVTLSPTVDRIIIGGEEALPGILEKWQHYCHRHQLKTTLFNTYGPTETTVIASRTVLSDKESCAGALPIGNAIDNTALYVLNEHLQMLPAGFIGEIAICGPGLALEYINQPELTAKKFVNIPDIGRAYLTGDLGYYQRGNLYYIGRKDFQIKIRGYRVELGEIEQQLSTHPDIKECLVISRDTEGSKQLVAYYVASCSLTHLQIRHYLSARLPDYMLPAVSMQLPQLPRTLTGKYDRKALPVPQFTDTVTSHFTDPYQELLAQIWRKLLGEQPLVLDSHFFRLGGHSILATKLIAEVRNHLQLNLSFSDVFRNPELGKLATLIRKKQNQGGQELSLPPIKKYPKEQAIPLSFQQERVWFLQQLQPANTAYNFQLSFWLRGPLQTQYLAEALTEIVARQQLWYTSFHQQDGIPYQKIEQPFDVNLQIESLLHLDEEQRASHAQRLLEELSQIAFDVGQLPLIRWKLLKLEPDLYQLIQVEHHLVHDGWSVGLFLKELQNIYHAKLSGTSHSLQALEVTYADFCFWQREALSGPYFSQMEQYWLNQLADCPTQLALPYDYARPAVPTFRGDSEMFHLPDELYTQVRQFGKEHGYTLYMTMLAAYYVMLYRYSQQTDICVGAGAASRNLPELQPIIGMMVNSIVLRADLSGEPTFLQFLDRVKATCLGGYSHQDMPFEHLVKKLCPTRSGHANPLFQTMFSFHDAEVPELDFGGLQVSAQVKTNKSAKLDLNIIVAPQAEQRVGKSTKRPAYAVITWEYSTELFHKKTILDMIDCYLQLLDTLTKQPEVAINKLHAISTESTQEQLYLLNDTNRPLPAATVPALFDEQVAASPDNIAIMCEQTGNVSYRQLQRRSLQLAEYLKAHHIGANQIVGLAIAAGPDLYAAMLACLRLGASYMPVDLDAGENRLNAMFADIRAQSQPVILTQLAELDGCPTDINVISLPRENAELLPVVDYSEAEQQAYVLYTSGTTGRPKGVCVAQRAIIRLVKESNFLSITPTDRLLQHSSVFFDASVLEIWGALLNGAALIVPAHRKLSLDALHTILLQKEISILWLTAGMFHAFADHMAGSPLPYLRVLLAGGDTLSAEKVRTMLGHYPDMTIINGYGPTENTTFSYCYVMNSHDLAQWRNLPTVPLGFAVNHTRGYILDKHQQLLPYGATGELYLAGEGLAQGYLDLPEQTSQQFIELTLGHGQHQRQERLYRTGDLVRYTQDGLLCFVGRQDSQVKIRGFRVELMEVEEVLRSCPGVEQAVVITEDDPALGKLLRAFVTTNGKTEVLDIERFCQKKLQHFQQLSSIAILPAIPLTAVGKVDKKALSAHQAIQPVSIEQPPTTEIELTLAEIWFRALGKPVTAITQNFFSLGGHSLVAVKVIADIHQCFNVRISLLDFFQQPTISSLSTLIEHAKQSLVETTTSGQCTPQLPEEADLASLSDTELDEMLAALSEQE